MTRIDQPDDDSALSRVVQLVAEIQKATRVEDTGRAAAAAFRLEQAAQSLCDEAVLEARADYSTRKLADVMDLPDGPGGKNTITYRINRARRNQASANEHAS